MKLFLRYYILFIILTFSYSLNAADERIDNCPHCNHLRTECLTAREGAGGSSGKWNDTITPKRGWTCTGAEDLGVNTSEQCEMCEREDIRYVHYMEHGTNNPLNLRVGCVCSGHMEGRFIDQESIDQAKKRASELKNRATRRKNFPDLTGWEISKNGNYYINKDGYNIIIKKSLYGLESRPAVLPR